VQLDLRRAHRRRLVGYCALLVARAGGPRSRRYEGVVQRDASLGRDHRLLAFFYIAAGILTPGSIAFGIMLAKIEGRWPMWSLTKAVCGVFISLIVFLNACAWLVAAYRPETGADVIQSWYDWAWFAFLLGWIYLAIEMIATGVVELMDDSPDPMVPRWLTWLTFAGAATLLFAAGPAFFKSGPFAYHGLLAFYLPVVIWGGYIALTTWYMLTELKRAPDRPQMPAAPSTTDAG
jgi:hypothetical protein